MVEKITITQVRAIARTTLLLGEKTILSGKNGSGKTTIIEALHTTGWGRSFRTQQIQDLIADSERSAAWRITGATSGVDWQYTTHITQKEKTTEDISGSSLRSCRSVWENFLAITHSADRHELVAGAPSARRSLLFSSAILGSEGRDLYRKYHAIYKRRLALIKSSRAYDGEADRPWVSLLWQHGIPLRAILRRELAAILHAAQRITPFELSAHYIQQDPELSLSDMIEYHLREVAPIEYAAKRILMGPQRDDVFIEFNGKSARDRASRGQQRLSALALDAALAQHAADQYGYPILFMADDFLSDLDQEAIGAAWEILNAVTVQRLVAVLATDPTDSGWCRAIL